MITKSCQWGLLAVFGLVVIAAGTTDLSAAENPERPNIIVIMADDIGYSDISSYGGEIPTPNLDKLASGGIRFTQFYNMGRCCPSRAALMTGLYPHQAGIGHMLKGNSHPGYTNRLSTDSVTIAEVLKQAGYRTYMAGKWHLGRSRPLDRGFDKFYGIVGGAANYYDPRLTRDRKTITIANDPEYKPEKKYYFTDAISDNAIKYLKEHDRQSPDKPFFMYVAYTAAHWPIQAPEDEVARHRGKYDAGYDAIRRARFQRMKKLGLVDESLQWSETVGDWDKVKDKAWETRLMEVYAAMITRMDSGIGRIIETLKTEGELENTIVMYMQDNGGCAEEMWRDKMIVPNEPLQPLGPNDPMKGMPPAQTRDGRPMRTGPTVMAGPEDTYLTYGEKWANVSNTPFRKYKHWVHEGGISTPLIIHWPAGMADDLKNQLVREPSHLIDVMATAIDAAGTTYPSTFDGNRIAPLAGKSLLPLLQHKTLDRGKPIFWEHESNRAVRDGKWKLVTEGPGTWELYDISVDRAELHNLADQHPDRVEKMAGQWQRWAKQNDVLPLGSWKTARK